MATGGSPRPEAEPEPPKFVSCGVAEVLLRAHPSQLARSLGPQWDLSICSTLFISWLQGLGRFAEPSGMCQ